MQTRPRILFVSEAVSLAHVARPAVLASALDEKRFDIHFASSGEFNFCHAELNWTRHRLKTISPALFLQRLASGQPVYSVDDWQAYVKDDLALLQALKPDVVVSDFRLSMGISARLAGIPLLALCNAHWSPYQSRKRMQAPDLPVSGLLSHKLIDPIFNFAWPLASWFHTRAANKVRKKSGLPAYQSINELYCDGDYVLYADTPTLIPTPSAPPSHIHIGPIIWSPSLPLPDWWKDVCDSSPGPIYVTFGSTGKVDLLPTIVSACRAENARCIVATAGRSDFKHAPPDVFAAPFLPGSQAARVASLVIGNGGSATMHQAISQGSPVLGICSNLDQVLTMETIAASGAGKYMRASDATPDRIRRMLREILSDPAYREKAHALQADFHTYDPQRLFPEALDRVLIETSKGAHEII